MSFVIGATQRTQLTTGTGTSSSSSSGGTKGSSSQKASAHVDLGLPAAMAWRAGDTVSKLAPGKLPEGTAIATFDAKGRTHGEHIAMYLGHDLAGIRALVPSGTGRWQSTRLSFHLPGSAHASLNGNKYQVIER